MEALTLESPENLLPIEQTPSSGPGDEQQSPAPESITIDNQGDVILVAGSRQLRVASKVLTLSSPVFRAMLEPGRFLEGQTHRDSDNPAIVKLEEDDPEALTLLCDILHFKSVGIPSQIGLLVAVTDICDKYQCAPAIKCHIACWLSVSSGRSLPTLEQTQLLWVAFAFGLPAEFGKISSVLSSQLDAVAIESIHMHEGLPDSVRRMLSSLKKATILSEPC